MHDCFRVTDGSELFFEDAGSGPALLLLHGLMGTHDDFQHVFDLASLRRSWRVIAPDARGHGRSTNPRDRFSIGICAADVIALLDHLELASVCAIGASLGAKTLLHIAVRAPEKVSDMVLVSATPRFPEPTRALMRQAAAMPHSPDERASLRLQHVHGDPQIDALWRVPGRLADDRDDMAFTTHDLATIRARTLLVSGDRDPLYPLELAVELYQGIPGAALCVVPEGGHLPIFAEERDAFRARALKWLRVSETRGATQITERSRT
ncbi:MAG TPA: alpha/beta hydrolase [Polyangiaceae bacterium]|nr:alpha/beta hydrolase [Polyangiaceae bacterium]